MSFQEWFICIKNIKRSRVSHEASAWTLRKIIIYNIINLIIIGVLIRWWKSYKHKTILIDYSKSQPFKLSFISSAQKWKQTLACGYTECIWGVFAECLLSRLSVATFIDNNRKKGFISKSVKLVVWLAMMADLCRE